MLSRRRQLLADVLGLLALNLVLLDYLRPALLLLPTINAGGDTPCHYPTAAWFSAELFPHLRFHGWYPGAYLGQPLLLYYFPLPFVVMAVLAPLTGLPVAFKLGTALGIPLLPLLSYAAFRLMGFRFPGPLMGAAASFVFLFLEANPIWGGTIASTMTGEFSYTYGIGLAVLFLGVAYRCYSRGEGPLLPAVVLAISAFAHGYAVLWAGLSAAYFLYASRRPWKTLRWLAAVAALAFALAGFLLVPLLQAWGWTTPYDDAWIDVTPAGLAPPYLAPLLLLAGLGLVVTLATMRRHGGPDHRLLFLLHAALVAAALAAAGPALGVIDVRFVPFAQLALVLAGGATLGLALETLAAPDLAALACVIAAACYADGSSQVCRSWIEYNYTGLEAKELWPAFKRLAEVVHGGVADPRVAVEYSHEHEKAGSIRMYETIPYFSGRSTLEGVYNQASLSTHFVYYLASELNELSPNPFRSREYSTFDTDNALRHLRLFNAGEIVALSPKLVGALSGRDDVERVAEVPPYTVFRIKDSGPGYVEPLAFEPVRSSPLGWRDKAYRWFTRKPQSQVHLVFTDDARIKSVEPDEWLPPPAVPLPGGVFVQSQLGPEEIRIHTSRVGHPLLVKVSYHPRWKAEGADGPYLVSPALMLIVPRQPDVRLVYAPNWADRLGTALSLGGIAVVLALLRRGRPPVPIAATAVADLCGAAPPPRRWGSAVPAALLLLLAAGRLTALVPRDRQPILEDLYARASRAYAAARYADAAEYARNAIAQGGDTATLSELQCLRGESLLRAERPWDAVSAFVSAYEQQPSGPHAAQALFGEAAAREVAGDAAGAATARERLKRDFPRTPWAGRLQKSP